MERLAGFEGGVVVGGLVCGWRCGVDDEDRLHDDEEDRQVDHG